MLIEYESEGFAERARKLVSAARPFQVAIRGEAKAALEAHLVSGKVADPPKLALTPALQPLLGVLMFADGMGRAVSIESADNVVMLSVGAGQA